MTISWRAARSSSTSSPLHGKIGAPPDTDDARAQRAATGELDQWDEPNFARYGAALRRRFPDVNAYVFKDLSPSTGTAAVQGVATFLARLDALESGADPGRAGTKQSDKKAVAFLATRGLDKAERKRLQRLVDVALGPTSPLPEQAELPEDRAPARGARPSCAAGSTKWSTTARAVIKKRGYLIRLGLASRKARQRKPAAAPPRPTATPSQPTSPGRRDRRDRRRSNLDSPIKASGAPPETFRRRPEASVADLKPFRRAPEHDISRYSEAPLLPPTLSDMRRKTNFPVNSASRLHAGSFRRAPEAFVSASGGLRFGDGGLRFGDGSLRFSDEGFVSAASAFASPTDSLRHASDASARVPGTASQGVGPRAPRPAPPRVLSAPPNLAAASNVSASVRRYSSAICTSPSMSSATSCSV